MALTTEVGLSPVHVVLDGDPAPPKTGTAPTFLPMRIVAKRLDGSRCTKVGLGPGHSVLDGDPAAPQLSARAYCGQTVAHLSYC